MLSWCTTCDACPAHTNHRHAGTSTAQRHHSRLVHSVMKKVGHSLITTGSCRVYHLTVVYSNLETQVLAFGNLPGQKELSVFCVRPFTPQVCHRTCICGIQQKWLWVKTSSNMVLNVIFTVKNIYYIILLAFRQCLIHFLSRGCYLLRKKLRKCQTIRYVQKCYTCAVGDLSGDCLCSIRGLCGDTEVILGARNQVSDIILSVVSHATSGLLRVFPGHIVAVAFLVLRRFWPCDCDGFLLCRSTEIVHAERSLTFKKKGLGGCKCTAVALNHAFDIFRWKSKVPHLWWPYGFEPPHSQNPRCPLLRRIYWRTSQIEVSQMCDWCRYQGWAHLL